MKQDSNLDFNGMAGDGVNRAKNRFAGNHSGLTGVVNAGRGPTGGSTKVPATSGGRGAAQVRNPGGTKAVPAGKESINVGRGPTKGNQQ